MHTTCKDAMKKNTECGVLTVFFSLGTGHNIISDIDCIIEWRVKYSN